MTASTLTDRPVFIGGLERSGKTYMRLMLAEHPSFAFTKRTNLWTHFYGRFGDLADDRNFDRCLEAMLANRHIRDLEPDRESLRVALRGEPRTYAHLFSALNRRHAERLGRTRWGDQSEGVERYAALIFTAFPEARFIHMVRDPRDRYEALVHRDPPRPGRLAETTARWRESTGWGMRHERRYSGRYRFVRYESLIAQPEQTLRSVCDFLDIDLTPEMMAMPHALRFATTPRKGVSPLSADYIGRFRKGLSAHETDYIQRRVGWLNAAFGYAPEPVSLSLGGRLRSGLTAPAAGQMVRLARRIARDHTHAPQELL